MNLKKRLFTINVLLHIRVCSFVNPFELKTAQFLTIVTLLTCEYEQMNKVIVNLKIFSGNKNRNSIFPSQAQVTRCLYFHDDSHPNNRELKQAEPLWDTN
jgi:hypothetical protein